MGIPGQRQDTMGRGHLGTGTPQGWGQRNPRAGASQGRGPASRSPRLRVTLRRRWPWQVADIRELPRAGEASAAFTFFRSYKDGLWRFESAANPGWFLCTSARGHQPLGLSRRPDATHLLDFYFQLC